MTTADMIPLLTRMDRVGYDSMEMWGGATFDVAIRFLKEDPWDRVREFKKYVTKTSLKMVLRAQNLIGYRAGVDGLDVCVSAMSMGPAQPPMESFLTALKGSSRDPKIDVGQFQSINEDFMLFV